MKDTNILKDKKFWIGLAANLLVAFVTAYFTTQYQIEVNNQTLDQSKTGLESSAEGNNGINIGAYCDGNGGIGCAGIAQ